MTDIKQWIDERGLYEGDYLGDLCKSNHKYLNTGKSIRAKPTNRKNGRCVCCKKVQSDKHYTENKEYYISKAIKRSQTLKVASLIENKDLDKNLKTIITLLKKLIIKI